MSEKKKSIAIMQPYFFPYIGYWQLMNAVDLFVVYDEGNYIKHGWIHRNRILRQGNPEYFGLKLRHANANKSISEIMLVDEMPHEVEKMKRTLQSCYSKRPFYKEVYPILEEILMFDSNHLASYLTNQIRVLCDYLDINTKILMASEIRTCQADTAYEQIASICNATGIYNYINPIGGTGYYKKEILAEKGVNLSFLKTDGIEYQQYHRKEFVPNMSIVDILMCCGREQTKEFMDKYHLT